MASKTHHQLHVIFFPFMAQGHLIPTIDMAKLFASRGSKVTIITTSYFVPFLLESMKRVRDSGTRIDILNIRIPTDEAGLPEGVDSLHMANTPEMKLKFAQACGKLGPQLEEILERQRPDCLVADIFFPWATDVAAKFGIPRLIFDGTSYFALCDSLCMSRYEPYKKVSSEHQPFIIPNLPDEIEFTKSRVPDFVKEDFESEFSKIYKAMKEVESRSYGVLVNSFYELEPAYADHYTKVLGIKAWHIGPLFLYDKRTNPEERAKRGMEAAVDEHECLKWLDSKKPNSVIYVCFGSLTDFNDEQLKEIAIGLEASGQQFILVAKKEKKGVKEEWLPEGFEERIEGKGLIIRGWAPQVVILEHEAVGGFVTHCGWNSTLEGVCAGVPMVTWPIAAEQFYNEKLVTQVLGIGIGVGVRTWLKQGGDLVRGEVIEKAVRRVMEGEEAEEMGSKARGLALMARRAIEEGGSSYLDLDALFEELSLARVACDSG